jgi:hypothetical protein
MVLMALVAAGISSATEYGLQIAHLEEKLFLRYVETRGAPLRAAQHELPQLQEALDRARLSPQVLVPGREVRLLDYPPATAGQRDATMVRLDAPRRENPWTSVVWEGPPGKTAVFQIHSNMSHYQELIDIAVSTDGVLRRLPVSGVPLFRPQPLPAPALSATYLSYALERGTFETLVARHAAPLDGLSIVVGRNANLHFPDSVYLVVHMPQEAKTYQVVLAWKDREELRKDNNDTGVQDQ